MDSTTAAAPAQPASSTRAPTTTPAATPAPATAVDQAVTSRDFGKFREAKRAAESGKPLEPAPPAKEPAAAATPAATAPAAAVSRRQQEINEHIRRATTAEQENTQLRERLARLEAGRPADAQRPGDRPTPPAAATPAAPAQPAATADPEPTIDQFDSYEKFVSAQSRWAARQEITAREQAAQTRAAAERRAEADRTRATRFSDSVQTELKTDAQFLSKVSPEVLALKPFSALAQGERGGPRNAIAEELLDSDVAPQLMRHFTEHPEELTRLERQPNVRALVREFGKLESRFAKTAAPAAAAPEPKTVPTAPAPPQTLGTRPSDPPDAVASAVKSRNFAAYREAKARQRTASR